MTKSVIWPINWSYDGDIDKAKEFHGEGRALIGQLKNQTYGGANLGSNRMVKTYADGVVIEANILPGIDKVHIFVPEYEGGEEEKKKYTPYLWVGARIVSGGTYNGEGEDTNVSLWNGLDYQLMLNVWEPPQESKKGQGWTPYDPNEIQMTSSWRHGDTSVNNYNAGWADMIPMQFHRYWNDDPTIFYSYGEPAGQKFVKRCTNEVYAEFRYRSGPGTFITDMTLQHTDDGLMTADLYNPYDPEYDHDNPDNDKIWYTTAWCDPMKKTYDWPDGPAPMKVARGYIASGAREGFVSPAGIETDAVDGYGWYQVFEPPEITARIIPGQYAVKVSLIAGEHCPYFDLPVVIEVEVRVGNPIDNGYVIKKKERITLQAHPGVGNYFCNFTPYGWYTYDHGSSEDYENLGDGFGPCPQPDSAWWQGGFLVDAFSGSISVLDNLDLTGDDYSITTTTGPGWGGTSGVSGVIDHPFADGQIYTHLCSEMLKCDSGPCAESGVTCLQYTGYPTRKNPSNPYAHYEWYGYVNNDAFGWGQVIGDYLAGRVGYIQATYVGADTLPIVGTDILLDEIFAHFVVICDPEYPNYNGERHPAYTFGQFENYANYDFEQISICETVIILIPEMRHLRVVGWEPGQNLLSRKTCSEFDSEIDPPDGYGG